MNSIISKKDSSNFFKQLPKVILVALFHFPKFQLGTKMGSRDIGKLVTAKVSFVEWLISKTHNFASDYAAGLLLLSL